MNKTRTIKVGVKKRHLTIPDGWSLVTEGYCQKYDKYADLWKICFNYVDDDDIGVPVEHFDFLIREDNVLPKHDPRRIR